MRGLPAARSPPKPEREIVSATRAFISRECLPLIYYDRPRAFPARRSVEVGAIFSRQCDRQRQLAVSCQCLTVSRHRATVSADARP